MEPTLFQKRLRNLFADSDPDLNASPPKRRPSLDSEFEHDYFATEEMEEDSSEDKTFHLGGQGNFHKTVLLSVDDDQVLHFDSHADAARAMNVDRLAVANYKRNPTPYKGYFWLNTLEECEKKKKAYETRPSAHRNRTVTFLLSEDTSEFKRFETTMQAAEFVGHTVPATQYYFRHPKPFKGYFWSRTQEGCEEKKRLYESERKDEVSGN